MNQQDLNMKFMQIAMNHLPEAKAMLDQKGIEVNMENLQPMLEMLMKVMTEAYELGREEAIQEKEE
ncbi:ComZ family protein [Bacillus tianshenii]|nr:ComZ family protein [Bacillus tianshenii]